MRHIIYNAFECDWEGERSTRSVRLFIIPIAFFLTFYVITIFVFVIGPWPWEIENPWSLCIFVFLVYSSLLLGYMSALKSRPTRYVGKWSAPGLLKTSLLANVVLFAPLCYHRANGNVDVVSAISQPGEAYKKAQVHNAQAMTGQGSVFAYVVVYSEALTAPITHLLLPLTLVYRRILPRRHFLPRAEHVHP